MQWSTNHLAAAIATRYRRNGQSWFDAEVLADQFEMTVPAVERALEEIGRVVVCEEIGDHLWVIDGEPELPVMTGDAGGAFTLAYHLCGWEWITLTELMAMIDGNAHWSRRRVREFVNHSLARILPLWSCSRCAGQRSDTVWVWTE